jgi:hypothetical protein
MNEPKPHISSAESSAITYLLQSKRFPETRKTLLIELESLIIPGCHTNREVSTALGISEPTWYRWRTLVPAIQRLHEKWRKYVDA